MAKATNGLAIILKPTTTGWEIDGGNGVDVIVADAWFPDSSSTKTYTIVAGNGDDTVWGSNRAEIIWGDSSGNGFNSDNGADQLHGGGGDDEIHGGNGADLVAGDGGKDKLYGDNGADTILGGAEADWMWGGKGGDTFSFMFASDSTANSIGGFSGSTGDVIADFNRSEGDKLNFSGFQLTGFSVPAQLNWGSGAGKYKIWADATYVYADSDGDGAADFVIQVPGIVGSDITGVNHGPTIVDPAFSSLSVAENTEAVTVVVATDPDAGNTLTYSLLVDPLTDYALFAINATTGVLTFKNAPDFENPTDLGADHVYVVQVRVDDGMGGVDTKALSIVVTDVNEAPTAVVLSNQVTSTPENGATLKVADIAVTDDALGTNVLSLSGADASSFTLVGNALWFNGGANFEVKNAYDVTVAVNDVTVGGTPDALQAFHLDITDVEENDFDNEATSLTAVSMSGNGNGSSDTIRGSSFDDTLLGGGNSDTIYGGAGNDTIYGRNAADSGGGTDGADVLYGGSGSDTIFGQGENDTIYGGSGNDILIGGIGSDTLIGGLGSDFFRFRATNEGVDTIADFNSAQGDKIQFDNAAFTAIGADGTLAASAFHLGAAATSSTDRIIFDTVTKALYYDADGSLGGVAVQIATLTGISALTNADIVVI